MSASTTCRIFRFGAFEVNEAGGELRKQGVRIKLHSQPFQVLVMLLERPSELVSRDEIRQRLWGDGTFVDFNHGLNTAVNKLRQALRDSASEPRYVETIPGKGYRFIAPVIVAGADPLAPSARPAGGPSSTSLLTSPSDLPDASRVMVRSLLILGQAMYLAFYLGALANLREVRDILEESGLPVSALLFGVLVTTAAGLIPVRLFLCTAVAFNIRDLPEKFGKLFPFLLVLDLLWALSPCLLVHHLNIGLALGMCAALVYMPFAQRSLVLMYGRS